MRTRTPLVSDLPTRPCGEEREKVLVARRKGPSIYSRLSHKPQEGRERDNPKNASCFGTHASVTKPAPARYKRAHLLPLSNKVRLVSACPSPMPRHKRQLEVTAVAALHMHSTASERRVVQRRPLRWSWARKTPQAPPTSCPL